MLVGFDGRSLTASQPLSMSHSLTQKAPFILFAPWSETTRTAVAAPALAKSRPILSSRSL